MNKSLDSPLRLSLCMIVKNEKPTLPRCLDSVKAYVDEIVIVDTGSEDGTPEIALNYGAKVRHFEWCDDFAAARNYAISQASCDWILMMDADEELVVNSCNFLDELTSNSEIIAYVLTYTEVPSKGNTTPSYRTSLFRNTPDIKYFGCFHEHLKYQNKYISENHSSYLKSINILHYGFSMEHLRQKNLSRNIPMLERIRQEETLSLRLLSTLAGMYSDIQQPEKAQQCYAEIFERLLPNLIDGNPPDEFTFVPDIVYILGAQALEHKDYETARLLCHQGLEWCPNYPPLNYLAGVTIRALGFPLGAVAYFENCIQMGQEESYYKGEPFELSYMTTYPAYDLGCVYIELKRWQKALLTFELALYFDANLTEALDKINKIKELLATYT